MSEPDPRVGQVSSTGRVARVALDNPLPHLDRWFDYAVPEKMAESARPGVRVRVRFAGKLTDGFIVELGEASDRQGDLQPLERVVSGEVVLTPDQVRLVRSVADHWLGTFSDVVRQAVVPRHATTEKASPSPWPDPAPTGVEEVAGPLVATRSGAAFLAAIARGDGPRAHWQVPPVHAPVGEWTSGLAQAVASCLASDRRALLVVPGVRQLEQLRATLVEVFGKGTVALLHSDLGPSARYRNYLAVSRGSARIVVGTRNAVLAPMPDCGLVAVWDEADDLLAEPRAPYFHARDVAAMRAAQQGAALLLAGYGRSCEVQRWLESGWLHPLCLDRQQLRRHAPATRITGASDHQLARDPLANRVRLPAEAFTVLRQGLTSGPVLVQVGRAGYTPALSCADCGERARCQHCHGPLQQASSTSKHLDCGWCGAPVASFRCQVCQGIRLRAPVKGSERTATELGRAFPGIRVLESSGDHILTEVPDEPCLVVATQGAEPPAPSGYSALVVLDTLLALSRPDLRAGEESLRRWLNAVALVRPAEQGGTVCAVGPSGERALQGLVRLDPATFAARELDDRREAGFPPAVRFVQLEGSSEGVTALVGHARLLPEPDLLPGAAVNEPLEGMDVLGPVADGEKVRLTLRTPLETGAELGRRLRAGQSVSSARKAPPVRTQVDPVHLS